MARTLVDSSLTTGIVGVFAAEDDGATIGLWETAGAGLTRSGSAGLTVRNPGLSIVSGQSFGSSTDYAILTTDNGDCVVVDTEITLDNSAGGYVSYYAAIVDYDGGNGTQPRAIVDCSRNATGTLDWAEVDATTGKQVWRIGGTAQNPSDTALAGDTAFGVGGWWRFSEGTDACGFYYGAAGSAGGDDGPTSLETTSAAPAMALRAFLGCEYVGAGSYLRPLLGKTMLVAVWNRLLTEAEFQAINVDPMGVFFPSSGTSVAPLAMSAYSRMRNG